MTNNANFEVRLAALLAKTQDAQNHSDMDFDWDRRARLPHWLPKRVAATAVSQFYYGEKTTARMCLEIRKHMDLAVAREFLEMQNLDEIRHATIYAAYLEKIGGVTRSIDVMQSNTDRVLAWTGAPEAIILALHIVLEGQALRMQQKAETWLPCPLFKDISRMIARDEARHIAFGKIYLQMSLPLLSQKDRLEIYCWVRDIWFDTAINVAKRCTPSRICGRGNRFRNWILGAWNNGLDDLQASGLFCEQERATFIGQ